ncbi:MAG: hypothetical protein WC897_02955 [Candidatus Gracilibacteria bacterium]
MQSTEARVEKKRVNFMANICLLNELEAFIPSGGRSDFINNAIEQALKRFSIKMAMEETSVLREKLHLKIGSDEKLYKKIRAGRL